METHLPGIDLATPHAPCHGLMRKPTLTRMASLVSAAGAALLIAACGGGGGTATTTAADPVDKYLGTWGTTACFVDAATGVSFNNTVFTATKIDATRASFTTTASGFANPSCTAPPAATLSLTETAVHDGTATVDGKTVDRFTNTNVTFTVTDATGTTTTPFPDDKDIAFVNGNQLQFGDGTSPPDAQGYPTALDTTFVLTRR